jgi:hypothetical protein
MVAGCGVKKSEDSIPEGFNLADAYAPPRNLVAPGSPLTIAGTSTIDTSVEVQLDGVKVGTFEVKADSAFAWDLTDFGDTATTEKVVTLVSPDIEETKIPIVVNLVELETNASAFLNKYVQKNEAKSLRWKGDKIPIKNNYAAIESDLQAMKDVVTAWTGIEFVDSSEDAAIVFEENDTANGYQGAKTFDTTGFLSYTVKVGADVATRDILLKLLATALGLSEVAEDDADYGGSALQGFSKPPMLFPYEKRALAMLYSNPLGQDLFTPDSVTGARVVNSPKSPMTLVMDGTLLAFTVEVKHADSLEVVVDGDVVDTIAVDQVGYPTVELTKFGTEGKKDITLRAVHTSGNAEATLAIENNPTDVNKLALKYLKDYLRIDNDKITRWEKVNLTILNQYPEVQDALEKAIVFLNKRTPITFTLTTDTKADINVLEDTKLDGSSTGGQSSVSNTMSIGVVNMEPDHVTKPGIVAHELAHVLGLAHVADADTTNIPSLMTPILSDPVLFPHQQRAIEIFYKNDAGTAVDALVLP